MHLIILLSIVLFIVYIIKTKGYEHCFCPECGHLNLHIKDFNRINAIKGFGILVILIGITTAYLIYYLLPILLGILYFDKKGRRIDKSCTKCKFVL